MLRRIFVAAAVALGLALVGCGGGGGSPVTSANVPTGSVEGRLVTGSSTTSKSRQVATRFRAKVHGLETQNTFRLQVRTNGEFRIDGVPAGEQVISLEDEENSQGVVFVCLVRPNQVTNVGEVVPQPLGMISGIVSATNKDGQTRPVVHARVIARPINEESETVGELSSRPFFTDVTDKNGSYRLLVPEGTYLVEVRHPDYEPASKKVTVEAYKTVSLDFSLTPIPVQGQGIVYGTVMAEVNGNLLPVPGALVMLKQGAEIEPLEGASPEDLTVGQLISEQMNPTNQGLVPPGPPIRKRLFTFTKADGSFELTGVPAGTYTAIAFKPGYGRDERLIEVKAGERTQVDFVLKAQFATISGQVTDATTGHPIKNALVIAVRKGDIWWIWEGWEQMPESESKSPKRPTWHRPAGGSQQGMPSQTSSIFPPLRPVERPIRVGTITDDNGNYKLILPPADYFVAAVAEGYNWQAQEVELQAGQTVQVDFALQPSGSNP